LAIYFPRVLQAFCDGRSLNCQSVGVLAQIKSQAADTVKKALFARKVNTPGAVLQKVFEKIPFL